MSDEPNRRSFLKKSGVVAASVLAAGKTRGEPVAADEVMVSPPFLTPAEDFYTVARGNPKPHTLKGKALAKARLTPETWRLEITADLFCEIVNRFRPVYGTSV